MNDKTTSMPYDWLKQIPTALLQLDEIPLFGSWPPFPWAELSQGMSDVFQIPDFKIEPAPFQWRTQDELTVGLGEKLTSLVCTIPSLEGHLYWLMATEDVRRFMSLLLNIERHEQEMLEEEFLKGFYYFAAYEAIHLVTKLPFGSSLSPQIQEQETLPKEAALSTDIQIHLRGKVLVGRILISPSLQRAWKERHAERSLELPIHSSVAEKLNLTVHIEAGRTAIKPSEWKTVKPGDFILLDSCTVEPYIEKGGRVTLTVNEMPFYIGKLKDGNIKILDHPLYYPEEEITMSNTSKDTPEEEEEPIDYDSEIESEESEIESDAESEEESALEAEEESSEVPEEPHPSIEEEHREEAVSKAETPLKLEDIPLSIVVEVGRLQMSVKAILELQPGNLLELNVHPENGVDLVVNGKRIAKGELVKLGETLGVRILDIG